MIRFVSTVAAIAMLAGCAEGPSRTAVLNGLIGQPENEAVRVLGVPARSFQNGGKTFLAFVDRETGFMPASPLVAPYGAFAPYAGFGFPYGYYVPPTYPVVRTCETTLEIAGGRVASWSAHGDAC